MAIESEWVDQNSAGSGRDSQEIQTLIIALKPHNLVETAVIASGYCACMQLNMQSIHVQEVYSR